MIALYNWVRLNVLISGSIVLPFPSAYPSPTVSRRIRTALAFPPIALELYVMTVTEVTANIPVLNLPIEVQVPHKTQPGVPQLVCGIKNCQRKRQRSKKPSVQIVVRAAAVYGCAVTFPEEVLLRPANVAVKTQI